LIEKYKNIKNNKKSVYGGTKVYSLEGPKENFKVCERNCVTWSDVY